MSAELEPGDVIRLERGRVILLDQRELPARERHLELTTVDGLVEAIAGLAVRGAPAIGIAGAMGVAMACRAAVDSGEDAGAAARDAAERLRVARPTAVNLAWAVDLQAERAERSTAPDDRLAAELERGARALHDEEVERCERIGAHGRALIGRGARILTHCNTGALATGGYGTALGVIRAAHQADPTVRAVVDETRPLLQGARLTTWELDRLDIRYTLICDNMAASLMADGRVSDVIVGADRIAANGDVANKIGTYGVAILAREHGIPFYVAAPTSTVDLSTPTGREIAIEERRADEVRGVSLLGRAGAPPGAPVANPAFDVTPARLIAAIVTEQGVHRPPYDRSLRAACAPADESPRHEERSRT
jgi:methylthioribose-1-phosphate isomerase